MTNDQGSEHFDVDVAIVGGGPVGLLLAAELLLGGVSVQVLERTTEASSTIKAGSINIASAEILARRGLLSRAREAHGRAVKRIAETMAGSFGMEPEQALAMATKKVVRAGHFAAIPLDNEKLDQTDADVLGHSEVIDATLVVQREVELLLEDHAASLGVTIRRGIAVTGLEQSAQGVIVHTDVGDISARYVVGCDGGRSVVRKAMGFDFPGTDPEITGRQAVVDLDDASKLKFGWNWTTRGVFRYGPLPGVVLTVEFDGPPADRNTEVTAEEIQESLQRTSGTDVRVLKLHGQATRWTDNARQASVYRQGRILLAGDAAHVHSPFSGQGLNLGMGDATNLGWKLAATVLDWAPEGLLDTYNDERHPVGEWVLDWTRSQVALMRPDIKVGQLRRIVADMMDTPDGMTRMINLISGVTQRIALSGSHPLMGRVIPDIRIGEGGTLRDAFVDGQFVLLDRSEHYAFSATAEPWHKRVNVIRDGSASNGADLLALLARPDGVVVWAATTCAEADLQSLNESLVRWAGQPPSSVEVTPDAGN
jgi:2-polyprenyl-6-methoxyphenol hydroxylase-like FAD-dependent oxidoreductase